MKAGRIPPPRLTLAKIIRGLEIMRNDGFDIFDRRHRRRLDVIEGALAHLRSLAQLDAAQRDGVSDLLAAAKDLLRAFEELLPGLARISVKDYANVNEAPVRVRKALARLSKPCQGVYSPSGPLPENLIPPSVGSARWKK